MTNASSSFRSYCSAHSCRSVLASISSTCTRSRSPTACTLPSTTLPAQLPGDLPEGRDVRARVLHDGSATDDLDGTHPRELIEDLVLQPAGEVLPPTVGAQVFEGQHGDGRAVEWRLGRAQ